MDSGKRQRAGTKDSDMSDEFFGFTSSKRESSEDNVKKPQQVADPLGEGSLASAVSKSKEPASAGLFVDDADPFASSRKDSEDNLFGIAKQNDSVAEKTAESLNVEEELFASLGNKKNVNPAVEKVVPTKAKVSDPLEEDDDLFGASKASKPKAIEKKRTAQESKTITPHDLVTSSQSESKPSEKEKPAATKTKSPLEDDDDLFGTGPTKKGTKTAAAKKKEVSAPPAKIPLPLDDDDLFAVAPAKKESKSAAAGKKEVVAAPAKVSSPLDDEDLFATGPARAAIKAVAKADSPQPSKKTPAKVNPLPDVSETRVVHLDFIMSPSANRP